MSMNIITDFIAENPRLVIGNAIGLVSAVFGFVSYQAKTPKTLLKWQFCVSLAAILSYAVLGAWSGMALNAVCLFRNFTFTGQAKKIKLFSLKTWPYIIAAIMGGIGALSWQGVISLFVVVPLMANTVFLSLGNNKILRQSILVTSSLVIVYNAYFSSYFSILMEAIAIVSSVIGLIRYRNQK